MRTEQFSGRNALRTGGPGPGRGPPAVNALSDVTTAAHALEPFWLAIMLKNPPIINHRRACAASVKRLRAEWIFPFIPVNLPIILLSPEIMPA